MSPSLVSKMYPGVPPFLMACGRGVLYLHRSTLLRRVIVLRGDVRNFSRGTALLGRVWDRYRQNLARDSPL